MSEILAQDNVGLTDMKCRPVMCQLSAVNCQLHVTLSDTDTIIINCQL